MDTKRFSRFSPILLLAIAFTGFAGCSGCDGGFNECLGPSQHSFEQKVVFEPEKLQYHIGDTIWISSSFSCQGLLNTATGLTEDYCGVKSIGSAISIRSLYHYPLDSIDFAHALDKFDYISIEGNVKSLNRYASDINFQIEDTEYSFKIGIIPKVVGKYAVFISDSGPTSLTGSERCDKGGFTLINGNNDNHFELIQEYYAGEVVSDFDRIHNYCFIVVP